MSILHFTGGKFNTDIFISYESIYDCDFYNKKECFIEGDNFIKKYNYCSFRELCCEITALRFCQVPIIKMEIKIYKKMFGMIITSKKAVPLKNYICTDEEIDVLTSDIFSIIDRGIVHGDIKPDNIVRYNGKLCLIDYGLVTGILDYFAETQSYLNFKNSRRICTGAVERFMFSFDISKKLLTDETFKLDCNISRMLMFGTTACILNVPQYVIDRKYHFENKHTCIDKTICFDRLLIDEKDMEDFREFYDRCATNLTFYFFCEVMSLYNFIRRKNLNINVFRIMFGDKNKIYFSELQELIKEIFLSYLNDNDCPYFDFYINSYIDSARMASIYAGCRDDIFHNVDKDKIVQILLSAKFDHKLPQFIMLSDLGSCHLIKSYDSQKF